MLDDTMILETTDIENWVVMEHIFLGTVPADNLAAHALRGFYYNFSTIARFCQFCNCTKNQLFGNVQSSSSIEWTQIGYINI